MDKGSLDQSRPLGKNSESGELLPDSWTGRSVRLRADAHVQATP